ncbi:histidine kinase [Bacillus sp. JJ1521]|uniref:sensor histidine kinase n=1 Tax=Bacillus sp. JJ1521 TaxID=3122957 RepID=UPI002FFE8CF1
MIIRIRTKLLLYFMIIFIILNAVAFLFYKSSEKIVSEYDDSFEKFLLLNDISQQVHLVNEKVQSYIVEEEDTFLKEYFRARKQLLTYQGQLISELSNENNAITLSNYKNMISSYIEATDLTIGMFQKKEINRYSTHLNEATKFAGFIQETTLSLVNNELTDYQLFYEEIEKQNRYFNLMGISLFGSTLLLSLLLAMWLSGGITKPIRQLSEAANEISEGNFSGDEIKVTTNDEFKLLTNTFNQMRLNIRQLVSEIKQQSELDKLLKEMELKSLQNQINPHFLFNTLNTVSKMAYLEEAQNTSRLIEAIAALLRYNLGDLHKSSTLFNEVKIVKEYFYIQRTRFGERIDFKLDVDPDCLNIEIPSLSLQPIIENAFIHGIESKEDGGIIKLKVFHESDRIHVEISDNGAGMDENTLTKLRQIADGTSQEDIVMHEESTGHSTGIGVKNVIQRLQLFYKRTGIVEIESIKDSGTTFRLLLPYDNKEETDHD